MRTNNCEILWKYAKDDERKTISHSLITFDSEFFMVWKHFGQNFWRCGNIQNQCDHKVDTVEEGKIFCQKLYDNILEKGKKENV